LTKLLYQTGQGAGQLYRAVQEIDFAQPGDQTVLSGGRPIAVWGLRAVHVGAAVPSCPAERSSARFGELPLARPDEDVWAYVNRA